MKRLLIGTLMLFLAVGVASAQPALELSWSQPCAGRVIVDHAMVECWVEAAPPIPTETPIPGATETPATEPTATPSPEPTPTATPVGVLMCAHDPLVWHDLYDEALGCRYSHEHGDDPNLANAIFGSPGAWFGQPGYEIGSPAFPEHEMADGHPLLKWYVHTDIPASMSDYKPAGGSYIKAVRIQVHVATGGVGLRHRFHGFEGEYLECQPAPADSRSSETCGIVRSSGVLDYGNLRIVSDDPTGSTVVLLPNEPDGQGVELPQGKRIHVSLEDALAGQAVSALWYSGTWCAQTDVQQLGCTSNAVMIHDGWAYIEPIPDGVTIDWICGADYLTCGRNGSHRELHIVASQVNTLDVSWAGNADGSPNPSCTLGQAGCGMFVTEHVPEAGYMLYATHGAPGLVRDYDTSAGDNWIGYPN